MAMERHKIQPQQRGVIFEGVCLCGPCNSRNSAENHGIWSASFPKRMLCIFSWYVLSYALLKGSFPIFKARPFSSRTNNVNKLCLTCPFFLFSLCSVVSFDGGLVFNRSYGGLDYKMLLE